MKNQLLACFPNIRYVLFLSHPVESNGVVVSAFRDFFFNRFKRGFLRFLDEQVLCRQNVCIVHSLVNNISTTIAKVSEDISSLSIGTQIGDGNDLEFLDHLQRCDKIKILLIVAQHKSILSLVGDIASDLSVRLPNLLRLNIFSGSGVIDLESGQINPDIRVFLKIPKNI